MDKYTNFFVNNKLQPFSGAKYLATEKKFRLDSCFDCFERFIKIPSNYNDTSSLHFKFFKSGASPKHHVILFADGPGGYGADYITNIEEKGS